MSLSLAQGAYIIIGTYLKPTTSASLTAVLIVFIGIVISVLAYVYYCAVEGILSEVYQQKRSNLHLQGICVFMLNIFPDQEVS